MAFRFRQFLVEDEKSTMRVGTDSMVLGAWARPPQTGRILDIGTGCGVLTLMMAQHSSSPIDAIDPDFPSVAEASSNFEQSPWSNRLNAIHSSLHDFATLNAGDYDFIITNPPYFSNSLKSPSNRKNVTRHDVTLSLESLAEDVQILLSKQGRLAIILPPEPAGRFIFLCKETHLHLLTRMIVYPKPDAPCTRILMEFSRNEKAQTNEAELTILDPAGKYSAAYFTLTSAFHKF